MKIKINDILNNLHLIDEEKIIKRIAVYAICQKNGRLLMVEDSKSHNFEFPGGGIEKDEDKITALKRELKEETGLTCLQKQLPKPFFINKGFFFDLTSKQAWKTQRSFYLIDEVAGTLQENGNGEDVCSAKYIELSNINIPMSKTIKKIVNKIIDQLN